MIRTQIYLTAKQHQTLLRKAQDKKSTLSGVIRHIIDKDIEPQKVKKKSGNSGDALLEMAAQAKRMKSKGPADLASNVDKYLYGRED